MAAIPLLSPPPATAVLPVVDGRLAGVDVDELSVGTAVTVTAAVTAAGEGGPAVAAADWAVAMIMSLRVTGLPLLEAATAGSEVLATGSELALWMSGSFFALNNRILAR